MSSINLIVLPVWKIEEYSKNIPANSYLIDLPEYIKCPEDFYIKHCLDWDYDIISIVKPEGCNNGYWNGVMLDESLFDKIEKRIYKPPTNPQAIILPNEKVCFSAIPINNGGRVVLLVFESPINEAEK